METTILLTILLVALIGVVALQGIQLVVLGGKINGGGVAVAKTSTASSSSSSSSASVPSSLQNLPQMVGGC